MKERLLKLVIVVLFLAVAGIFSVSNAQAARCTVTSGGDVHCANNSSIQWYWCGLLYTPRPVHWQVPEGTAPSGGWPVVYWFEGTSPNYENDYENPLWRSKLDVYGSLFGLINEAMTVRTLLDDVYGTGKKYAVLAPAPPQSTVFLQFWHTNIVFPYSISCDYSFFNTFFPKVDGGSYGKINNSKRFASGVSSGGYNTSRMAITFNGGSKFRSLAIQSASYADCSGSACALPCAGTATIPSNHPPTKFYHGVYDPIVPIFTMRCYYDLLISKGKVAAKLEFTDGGIGGLHGYSTYSYDSVNGVQAWFNAHQ
jgi:poly(3-hydroxyoctanoate) depolymerase